MVLLALTVSSVENIFVERGSTVSSATDYQREFKSSVDVSNLQQTCLFFVDPVHSAERMGTWIETVVDIYAPIIFAQYM